MEADITKKVKLYLDIDGVLFTKKGKQIPDKIEDFIDYILENFDCYWLTTHCKGDSETALKYLSEYYPSHLLKNLQQVKPTSWDTLKTEAIDFESEFFWLDDEPLQAEIRELEEKGYFSLMRETALILFFRVFS